MLEVLKLLQI